MKYNLGQMHIKKILIIVQRSNGDVLLCSSLINALKKNYNAEIDLLVNNDTLPIAKMLDNVNSIITFSYKFKEHNRWKQEIEIAKKIYKKYDLSISVTSSDRSIIYCWLASKLSIGAIDNSRYKSWWKKIILSKSYLWDSNEHILLNNLKPLEKLKIPYFRTFDTPQINIHSRKKIKFFLDENSIKKFVIFHPSAQYWYKVYPEKLRIRLLKLLSTLNIDIIVTGGNTSIDLKIRESVPKGGNIFNLIGKTSLEDFFALSHLSIAYIGMDTMNMHIAASQNKKIFAIFGPTNLKMWSPWSNKINSSASTNKVLQTYGDNTIFQGSLPCVACGKAGCDNLGIESICFESIDPYDIFKTVKTQLKNDKSIC